MHFCPDSQTPSPTGKGGADEAPPGSTVLLARSRGLCPAPAVPATALGLVLGKVASQHCSERRGWGLGAASARVPRPHLSEQRPRDQLPPQPGRWIQGVRTGALPAGLRETGSAGGLSDGKDIPGGGGGCLSPQVPPSPSPRVAWAGDGGHRQPLHPGSPGWDWH